MSSDLYDDAIVTATAAAMYDPERTLLAEIVAEHSVAYRDEARQVLDAVAPLIAAKALRAAARNCRGSDVLPPIPRSNVRKWLGDLANVIERGRS